MNKKHRYVPLAQIASGATLADDLLDKLGHVLLPAGTQLTATMLKAVANHNIHQLSIFCEDDTIDNQVHGQDQNQADEQSQTHQLDRINQLFRHTPSEGPTETLRTYIMHYRSSETP